MGGRVFSHASAKGLHAVAAALFVAKASLQVLVIFQLLDRAVGKTRQTVGKSTPSPDGNSNRSTYKKKGQSHWQDNRHQQRHHPRQQNVAGVVNNVSMACMIYLCTGSEFAM